LLQRCARWLLDAADRVGDKLNLTQEVLAQMLGVYRPSVTIAMRTLERAGGLVDYERGRVTIIDRTLLKDAACECYEVVKAEYQRLLPGPYPQSIS
jgi:DNA-binding FadR family transcriptional regulator